MRIEDHLGTLVDAFHRHEGGITEAGLDLVFFVAISSFDEAVELAVRFNDGGQRNLDHVRQAIGTNFNDCGHAGFKILRGSIDLDNHAVFLDVALPEISRFRLIADARHLALKPPALNHDRGPHPYQ